MCLRKVGLSPTREKKISLRIRNVDFKIHMFVLIHFTNLAAQNTAKKHMTKYCPQKSFSNNGRSVVKDFQNLV